MVESNDEDGRNQHQVNWAVVYSLISRTRCDDQQQQLNQFCCCLLNYCGRDYHRQERQEQTRRRYWVEEEEEMRRGRREWDDRSKLQRQHSSHPQSFAQRPLIEALDDANDGHSFVVAEPPTMAIHRVD